jgi:hypothetical protein
VAVNVPIGILIVISDDQKLLVFWGIVGGFISLILKNPKSVMAWFSSMFISISFSFVASKTIADKLDMEGDGLYLVCVLVAALSQDIIARISLFVKTGKLPVIGSPPPKE